MYNEEFLRRIGFTGFTHFREQDRDGFKRLTSVLFVKEGCFTIRVIFKSNVWEIELLKFEGNENEYNKYFETRNPTLEQIVKELFAMNL